MPAVCTHLLPLFVYGYATREQRHARTWHMLVLMVALPLALLTSNAHKEYRFALPCLPPVLVAGGKALQQLRQNRPKFTRIFVFLGTALNLVLIVFFSFFYQTAPVSLMNELHTHLPDDVSSHVVFLTECHATPFHSFVHRQKHQSEVILTQLDCAPFRPSPGARFTRNATESARFLENPSLFSASFLDQLDKEKRTADFVVIFESHFVEVRDALTQRGYTRLLSRHRHTPGASDLLLLGR
ncbi:MAG: hypothetical protein MHM6MM_000793 [Cercozoa sp. M6MM]